MVSNNSRENGVELSIIVLSYNTCSLTVNTLSSIMTSLKSSPLSYEIILFDNASHDATLKTIAERFGTQKCLRVIKSKTNLGFSKGNNEAVKHARGAYLLFLNSDIIVHKVAIESLFTYYQANQKKVHFLGGKLVNADGTPQPSAGPFYSLPVVFGALFLRGDYWGLTRYSPREIRKVDWVSGACILTKKEIFQSLHGFDEQIFMYMEEIDLLYRARTHGHDTYFFPDAVFTHLGSASSNGKTYPILQVYEGFLYFYRKHCSTRTTTILRLMLQLKARIALIIGIFTNNDYLKQTYEKALKKAQMA